MEIPVKTTRQWRLVVAAAAFATAATGSDLDSAVRTLRTFNFRSVRLAVEDLTQTYGSRYPKGREWLAKLDQLERARDPVLAAWEKDGAAPQKVVALARELERLRSEALLANPLLSFDKLLLVKRGWKRPPGQPAAKRRRLIFSPLFTNYGAELAIPVNHTSLASVPPTGWDNEIALLAPVRPDGKLTTLYRPGGTEYVGEIELHWKADRLLFTAAPGGRYRVFEMRLDGGGIRQVTPDDQPDVDNFDGAYLPDGRIIFAGNASYQAVPCWNGLQTVACLYSVRADGTGMRQLTFDQDEDSQPVVLNSGQVIYCRWEYTNTPHAFPHLLFQMNPDGTGQRLFYGTNSYWPNAIYFPRPIPGEATKIIGVVSGYHGDHRMGELFLIDPARGVTGRSGMVQKIPGRGRDFETPIRDHATASSWPKFAYPWPLSGKYFLVSMKPSPEAEFGIYLVDVWDNIVLVHESKGFALLEPVPLQRTPQPPVIAEKVDLARKDGVVYMHNVYAGPGLQGVPRGTVKRLRVHAYHYGYRGLSGWDKIGVDGPWEVMRILGTVPVEEDGSAMFRVPANTPLAVQPLDANGRAVQVMRSWFTVMPGEVRSCVGCHEAPHELPAVRATKAAVREPSAIHPFYGPARGFDFERDVQPVLDKYCVGCHGGAKGRPDLRSKKHFPEHPGRTGIVPQWWGRVDHRVYDAALMRIGQRKNAKLPISPAYLALHPYVRRYGLEGDYELSNPAEYHASTSELAQMLEKGHHGVKLDTEAWDRLYTWMDLNVPCHGRWSDVAEIPFNGARRRMELARLYAGLEDDPEQLPDLPRQEIKPVIPKPPPEDRTAPAVPGWPFDIEEARARQQAAGAEVERWVELRNGRRFKLVLIPPGEFVMGSAEGAPDERPLHRARVERPFWMAATEITNEIYKLFDPKHDSKYINVLHMNTEERGFAVNRPEQPVVRVSYRRAVEFCEWLSRKTGLRFALPTEEQWEWAARAGTVTPLYFGDTTTNFSRWANMADFRIRGFADEARHRIDHQTEIRFEMSISDGFVTYRRPLDVLRADLFDWMPRIATVDDRQMVSAPVGSYLANVWGLHDMHGNVAEWTRSQYRSYADGTPLGEAGRMVVRGGSWSDRPHRCTSAFRWAYYPWQPVYNVGIRVVAEAR